MNPILMFSIIMLILLLAPILSNRAKLPGIVGLILAGIIAGPHATGILKAEGAMELFSQVGLIYIMFLAGLEINLHEFSRQKRYSLIFGALTFLIPMTLGSFGAHYLLSFSWPSAILLASMFASHTLISFPITSRLGINRNKAVIATVGGTIITDTAALLVLALIAETTKGQLTPDFWAVQGLLLMAFVFFSLWILPRVASFCFQILAPDGGGEFILTLALVFITSHIAHLAGLEPIIGAFFAGLALSRTISEQSPLMNRLEFVGHVLFIPFFLISVGMLVNLRILVSGFSAWIIALFMIIVALSSKYAAALIFAKTMGFRKDEGKLIFGLSVNQAAATLAAVIVGLRLGIFNEAVLNGTILMILVTCIVGPLFTEKYGKKLARIHTKPPEHKGRGDSRIMIGLSREDSLDFLTDIAMKLRQKDSREPIFPLYVAQDGEDVDRRIAQGENILSKAVARIVAGDLPVSPISRIDVNIPGGILHAIKEWRIDALVLGSVKHEINFRNKFFRIYDKVLEESRQLIFFCHMTHQLNLDTRIILAIPPVLECQAGFNNALQSVIDISRGNKTRLTVLAVKETIAYVRHVFSKTLENVEVSFKPLGEWKNLQALIEKEALTKTDTIVLMAARKGRLAWQPSTEKIFHSLEKKFEDSNVIMVHPGDDGSGRAANTCPVIPATKAVDPEGDLLSMPAVETVESSAETAVRSLLSLHFLTYPLKIEKIMKKLTPLDPVALSPEIILLHTHIEDIEKPVVLLGKTSKGIMFPGTHHKTKAFFVLISPVDQTTVHLQTLAKIAQMARQNI